MSKKLSKFLLILAFFVLFPITMLTGCGATPINSANAVKFESDMYDETTGYAVFEVDLNVTTELTFKVNPSIWSGYVVQLHEIEDDYNNETDNHINYDLDRNNLDEDGNVVDGKKLYITVTNKNFMQIKVRITVTISDGVALEDYCLIRLKEYPSEIYLNQETLATEKSDYINAGGVYNIKVFGKFTEKEIVKVENDGITSLEIKEKTVIREITDDKYHFLVESNDETALSVLDSSRLKVCSLKYKIENATITIKMIDNLGNEKGEDFTLKLNLKVVLSPKSALISIDGYDKFIKGNSDITNSSVNEVITIDLNLANLETEQIHGSTYYKTNLKIELFDASNIYISGDEYSFTCVSDQQSFVVFDNDNKTIKFRKQDEKTEELTAVIVVTTSANLATGESYSASFTLKCIFPNDQSN